MGRGVRSGLRGKMEKQRRKIEKGGFFLGGGRVVTEEE